MSKWMCEDCKWQGTNEQVLVADNPFLPSHRITGCPDCREVNTMRELCDEPGCCQYSDCGFPTDDGGYRRTCFDHSKFKQNKEKS